MSILIFSEHGKYTTKQTLEEARTSADCANKTVVVTSVLTEAQSNILDAWPSDRALKVEKGGSIANSTAFAINGPFEAGLYPVFTGEGAVTGLTESRPEWFGAVDGLSQSDAVRTANTTAINKAFTAIASTYDNSIIGGELKITDTFEVNGSMLWGTDEPTQGKTHVTGTNSHRSRIISYYSGSNMIDVVGRQFLKISNITFQSAVTTIEVGLLAGRVQKPAFPYQAGGYDLNLNNVRMEGNFTKATLMTIGSEGLKVNNCYLLNNYAGASVYATGDLNTAGQYTAYGTLLSQSGVSTNTDIGFIHTWFYTFNDSQTAVILDDQFDGTFRDCLFIVNAPTPNTVKHVKFIATTGLVFNGRALFEGCLFEGDTNYFYFDYTGATGGFYDITVQNCTMVNFGGSPVLFSYKNIANTILYRFNWINNKSTELSPSFTLPATNTCTIHASQYAITFNGTSQQSFVRALTTAWASGNSNQSVIETYNTTAFGVLPSAIGLTPVSHTATASRRLLVAPVIDFLASALPGEIHTIETGYGGAYPAATTESGRSMFGVFDGIDWRAIGAYPGTPASSTATGKSGTLLYDASYIYMCTASNTWRRIAITGGW